MVSALTPTQLSTRKKPSICFVALGCYNLLVNRRDLTHIGGAEIQQWLMAKWLIDKGYRVSFVVLDHGQPRVENRYGLTVHKAYRKSAGIPGARFIFPRWSQLLSAMKSADADIYYQRGAGLETGQVALWCKMRRKVFIFACASDGDCDIALPFLRTRRQRILYRIGISMADTILVQSFTQQHLIRESFGIDAMLLRNSAARLLHTRDGPSKRNRILWVGRIAPEKRPGWLIDLARKCPGFEFDVVGDSNFDSRFARSFADTARELPNVHLHGSVPHSDMLEFYANSLLLCNTSPVEGFPNVYIEAWSLGIPVLTSFDPDGMISEAGAGWVRHTIEEFVGVLKTLATDMGVWQESSAAAVTLYEREFRVERNMPIFEAIINETVAE